MLSVNLIVILLSLTISSCVCKMDATSEDTDIMKDLIDTVERLVTRVESLEANDLKLQNDNALLKVRVSHLEQQAAQSNLYSRKLKTQIRRQRDTVNRLGKLLTSKYILETQMKHTTTNNTHIPGQGDDNQQLTNESAIKKATHGRIRRQTFVGVNVAFTARINAGLDGTSTHTGSVGQPVVFEEIVTNNGDAYDATTGEFRAPVAGTYVFSTTLVTFSAERIWYHIYKNGDRVSEMTIRGEISQYLSTSYTVVLELVPGDIISVRDRDSGQVLYGYKRTLFSGFLLHQHFAQGTISVVD